MIVDTKLITFDAGIVLENGEKLDSFDLMVESYGELNETKTKTILIYVLL